MADLFNPTAEFTASDKLACVKRELKYRRHVFAHRVAERKMTQAQMDREIGIMEAIEADYAKQADAEAGVGPRQ